MTIGINVFKLLTSCWYCLGRLSPFALGKVDSNFSTELQFIVVIINF